MSSIAPAPTLNYTNAETGPQKNGSRSGKIPKARSGTQSATTPKAGAKDPTAMMEDPYEHPAHQKTAQKSLRNNDQNLPEQDHNINSPMNVSTLTRNPTNLENRETQTEMIQNYGLKPQRVISRPTARVFVGQPHHQEAGPRYA